VYVLTGSDLKAWREFADSRQPATADEISARGTGIFSKDDAMGKHSTGASSQRGYARIDS
jgi:hypothetical protein